MKMEKCTGPNKVLLVLGMSTGVHREDCIPAKFCCKQP